MRYTQLEKIEIKKSLLKFDGLSDRDRIGLNKAIDRGIPKNIINSMVQDDLRYIDLMSGNKLVLGVF